MLQFTRHARERLADRLAGLVTMTEVISAVDESTLRTGENYVDVKHFANRIYLGNPALEETPKGDKITAKIVKDNRGLTVITIMLRKSTSHSDRYDL